MSQRCFVTFILIWRPKFYFVTQIFIWSRDTHSHCHKSEFSEKNYVLLENLAVLLNQGIWKCSRSRGNKEEATGIKKRGEGEEGRNRRQTSAKTGSQFSVHEGCWQHITRPLGKWIHLSNRTATKRLALNVQGCESEEERLTDE